MCRRGFVSRILTPPPLPHSQPVGTRGLSEGTSEYLSQLAWPTRVSQTALGRQLMDCRPSGIWRSRHPQEQQRQAGTAAATGAAAAAAVAAAAAAAAATAAASVAAVAAVAVAAVTLKQEMVGEGALM